MSGACHPPLPLQVCQAGTWSAAGAAQCSLCIPGTSSSAENATSINACKACGASVCSSAQPAKRLDQQWQAVFGFCHPPLLLQACLPGTWSAAGAAQCTTCNAGTFAPSYSSSTCMVSGAGFRLWTACQALVTARVSNYWRLPPSAASAGLPSRHLVGRWRSSVHGMRCRHLVICCGRHLQCHLHSEWCCPLTPRTCQALCPN